MLWNFILFYIFPFKEEICCGRMTYSLSQFSWTSSFSVSSVIFSPPGRVWFSLGILRCEGFIPRNWSFSLTKSHSFLSSQKSKASKRNLEKKNPEILVLDGSKVIQGWYFGMLTLCWVCSDSDLQEWPVDVLSQTQSGIVLTLEDPILQLCHSLVPQPGRTQTWHCTTEGF